MKKKSFLDRLPDPPPTSWQLKFTALLLVLLKGAGELQRITWTFIAVVFVVGLIGSLLSAAFASLEDEPSDAGTTKKEPIK